MMDSSKYSMTVDEISSDIGPIVQKVPSKRQRKYNSNKLEIAIAKVDNTKDHRPKDFQVSSKHRRDIDENLKNLSDMKCKAHRLYNSLTNFCGKMSTKDIDGAKKELKKVLEDGFQESQKLTDNIGETLLDAGQKYMKRLREPVKEIGKQHCRQFREMDYLHREYDFIATFFTLMNARLRKPQDFDETINVDSKFSKNCCIEFEETECDKMKKHFNADDEDENVELLKSIVMSDISTDNSFEHLDETFNSNNVITNDTLTKIKHFNTAYNFYVKKVEIYKQKMRDINTAYLKHAGAGRFIFNQGDFKIIEREQKEDVFKTFEIEELDSEKPKPYVEQTVVDRTKKSETYKKIRDMLILQLSDTSKLSKFVENCLPKVIPDLLYRTTQLNVEKIQRLYDKMYCFSKYLFAYTIITTLGHELVGKSDTTECKNLKEIYFKDPAKTKKDCLKKENIRSNFINTIFQKYFSMYLNIEGVGGAASGAVAFGGEAVAGGEASFGGALAGFGKVLGFGGV